MGKCMFSPDVVGTDAFLDLPDDAQLLYYRLGSEGTYGKIQGVRRIARGYGSGAGALQALYDAGYLFDYDGACWARHFWVNNTFKRPNHNYAETMREIVSGEIGFEGESFKSAFVCPEVDKPYSSLNQGSTYTDSLTDSDPDPVAGTDPATGPHTPTDPPKDSGEGAHGEGEDLHPCWCPKCKNAHSVYWNVGTRVMVRCPDCGEFENKREVDSEGYSLWNE